MNNEYRRLEVVTNVHGAKGLSHENVCLIIVLSILCPSTHLNT